MRLRTLGTSGTAGLLLLTLTLAACGSSGQSGTKAAPTKSGSATSGGQACEAKAGDSLVALTDDKQLQTVDNIIPA
ncbi:MAG: glycine/betaine ABC transporter substrate-binding protein, partial [Sporichthyaceae bacterium]